jgi:putative ABC transport system ATP-binding protein
MLTVELQNVTKVYQNGKVNALTNVTLSLASGEMVAIMGPSGAGKSTLMHIIGLLERPTTGTVKLESQEVKLSLPDTLLAHLRLEKIGFIFQSFYLLPRLTALENVLMPTAYRWKNKAGRRQQAYELLNKLGLAARANHKPSELSGGEKQRVAIARALINDPKIILADEPTGNLDSKSGAEVMEVLTDLNKQGKTVVIITHDEKVASYCQRKIELLDGKIVRVS